MRTGGLTLRHPMGVGSSHQQETWQQPASDIPDFAQAWLWSTCALSIRQAKRYVVNRYSTSGRSIRYSLVEGCTTDRNHDESPP